MFYALCKNLRSILRSDPHVVLGVDRHVIRKTVPKLRCEFSHQTVLLLEFIEKGFYRSLPRLLVVYFRCNSFKPLLINTLAVQNSLLPPPSESVSALTEAVNRA